MKPSSGLILRQFKEKVLAGPQSLRSELIASILVGLLAVFIPINIVNGIQETNAAINNTKERLVLQGAFVYMGVKRWRKSMTVLLKLLAFAPPIRKLDKEDTEVIFSQLSTLLPYRSWRLWNRDGDLLVGTNVLEAASRHRVLARRYFQESRQGRPSYGIYKHCLAGKPCYVESVPVYAPGGSTYSTASGLPIGVLNISISLQDTGRDSGLGDYRNQMTGMNKGSAISGIEADTISPLSLQNKEFTGTEVMMVSKDGDVIFPITAINDAISLQKPEQVLKGPWGPFVRLGLSASEAGHFQEVSSENRKFFAFSKRIDNQWSLVAVSDRDSSMKQVYNRVATQVVYQLLTLAGAILAITYVSRRYARRIELAAATIRQFSEGDFEARIKSKREGAVGKLYKDINQTGAKLRELLTSKLAHAVTDQQIRTATDIQKSFIVEKLPSTERVELAGVFEPAYEIGADWFDALSLDGITYVVIADVCDKGIASALFMSVFRSLTRYSLLIQNGKGKSTDVEIETILRNVIVQVNDYMADNHGLSSMFATMFLGAYVSSSQQLSYVCAGHEPPIIIRASGVLDHLETTGPAIGIFGGAQYGVRTTTLKSGQILFTYTDGLVDARSPANVSWGLEGVQGILASIDPVHTTAKELLDHMRARANQHRAGAEQFDDLTILIVKVND
jgi:serine phosphatase RsbU (regulator of sigma subunit)